MQGGRYGGAGIAHGWREAQRENFAEIQLSVAGNDDGAFDDVFEFANVARPVIGAEATQTIGRKFGNGLGHARAVAFDEKAREKFNVGAAIAEGRNGDWENVKAIVKIFAEASGGDFGLQVAIGGGNDADVDRAGLRAANGLEFAFLEHAQKFGLKFERKFADFVEKENSVIGEFEATGAAGGGSGEGAFFVAEEFAFAECGGNRCAVNADERPGTALALLVNGAGDKFLAGPGFTFDQHGGWCGCDLIDGADHGVNGWTVADHFAVILGFGDFALQIVGFGFQVLKTAFGGELVFDIAKNDAVAGASGKIEAGNAGFGGKLRTVGTNGIEAARNPGETTAGRIEFVHDGRKFLRAGGSEQRRQAAIGES